LSVHQLGSCATENDLDYLTGSSPSLPRPSNQELNESRDLIDYLTSTDTPSAIRLELTVDSRVISEKIATQFLQQIKDLTDKGE
jgi:hypothetical protein